MNAHSSKEYRYIFTTTWKQASKQASKHLASLLTTDWQHERQALDYLYLYLIFSCCHLPFCKFPKRTTTLHYRYDMQMYGTFLLFVNQHFPGLPASGTHCSSLLHELHHQHLFLSQETVAISFLADICLNIFCLFGECIHCLDCSLVSTFTNYGFPQYGCFGMKKEDNSVNFTAGGIMNCRTHNSIHRDKTKQ
jgi:hypothetical protein